MVLSAFQLAAIIFGSVVGLLAMGFRLTHETSGYMNLGHTVNLGVGMMLGFIVIQCLGIPPIMGAPFAFIITGAFNAIIYLVFFRRMETRNYSETLIALFGLVLMYLSWGVLTIATYLVCYWFPSEYWCAGAQGLILNHLHYYGAPRYEAIGAFLVIMLAAYFFNRTDTSLRFKALAENSNLLEICGINSERVRALAWFISGGLAGVAGVIIPYVFKGEFARDVQLLFVPMVVASILGEKREPWIAGLVGMFIGFDHLILLTWGQQYIGIWVGEYWSAVPQIFLVIVLSMKDRKLQIPNWVNPRRQ
ncbi:MAG: branched-chain amino acid ABC transporter permease [Candidatus Bathyarchaeota archaeon]